MRHIFHFNGVSKIDEVVSGNENFLGFMKSPKELIIKGNQANMIGFMSEHQKQKMMNTGLPKAESIIKKTIHDYLIGADFFNVVPWGKNVYQASKMISDAIKIDLSKKTISSTFNIANISLTEKEKELMFSQSGGELYNKQYENARKDNYFSPINENVREAEIINGITEEILDAMDDALIDFDNKKNKNK